MDSFEEENNHANKTSYRDIFRYAFYYWRQKRGLGLAAAAMMTFSVVADSVVPVYTGRIVDALTQQGDPEIAWRAVWLGFWGFAAVSILHHGLRVASLFFWNGFAVGNLYNLVTDGMRKVQRFSADWHANAFAGGTVRKITRGMWAFDAFEDTLLMGLLPAVTIMIAITVMLSVHMPSIGLIVAGLVLLYCAFSIWMSISILAPRFRRSASFDTRLGATLADIITGNPTVKSFGAEKREDALFDRAACDWRSAGYHAWQTACWADFARSGYRVIMNASVLAIALWMWHSGKVTPGNIVLVITTFFIIGGYLRDIGMHISHLQRAASDMDDIVSFWLRDDDVVDAPNAKPIVVQKEIQGDMIVFDRVGFHYPNTGKNIYKDLSVRIAPGEKLALVGPSGSGKSTFVKLLQRLYNVSSGEIRIAGQDISKVTLESLRQAVSLVPQDPILFHRSLSENIAYGRPGANQEDIIAAARKAFAHDFIIGLPKGYDTLVGERGVKLSGGERQRVAIARAILADSPILILDEATSSLDSISEHYIQKGLEALMAGRTTITIAHRLSTIQKADRILVFDQGQIVEQGNHKELMANPRSHYKQLYDMQVLGLTDADDPEPARIAG